MKQTSRLLFNKYLELRGSIILFVHNENMNLLRIVNVAFIIIIVTDYNLGNRRERKKLQIGVKKRPKYCTNKSKKGDLLHVNYKGSFENGTEFDTNYHRNQPFTFTAGSGQVIKGWDQGLIGMCIGELRKLVIPPELGYGRPGVPPKIPRDATLIFHIELLRIERKTFSF